MKRNLAKLVGILLLGGVALLVALPGCGGNTAGTAAPPTAVSPTEVSPAAVSPTLATAQSSTPTPLKPTTTTTTPQPAGTSTPASGGPAPVIDVAITTDPYLFIPETFTFQAGKTYLLRFKAPKEPHTFTVTGLALEILIFPDQVMERQVSFNDIGTYRLVCVYHESLGQIGKVIVTK